MTKILIVDDNEMNLTVIKELLSETEMTIDTAKDGHETLELTREGKYDVILMDHMMPYLDGIETFKMLRDEEGNPNRSTPVIALTANAVSGSKEKYLSEGFSDYISKPVDPAVLEEKLLFSISGNKKNIDTRQSTERKGTLTHGTDSRHARAAATHREMDGRAILHRLGDVAAPPATFFVLYPTPSRRACTKRKSPIPNVVPLQRWK